MPGRSFTEALNEIRWDIYDTNVIAREGGDGADKVGVEGRACHGMRTRSHDQDNKAGMGGLGGEVGDMRIKSVSQKF